MGYCIHQTASSFFIEQGHEAAIIEALKGFEENADRALHDLEIAGRGPLSFRLDAMLQETRWFPSFDLHGNITQLHFEGEKLWEDFRLMQRLAPFVRTGSFIEMVGEDGAKWRWVFDGQKCTEKRAKIVWE